MVFENEMEDEGKGQELAEQEQQRAQWQTTHKQDQTTPRWNQYLVETI